MQPMSSSKNLVPGIENFPDLRRQFLMEYNSGRGTGGCAKSECDKPKIILRYTRMVEARRAAR